MDYKAAVKNLFDSFTWDYTKEDCPEMFRYKRETMQEVINEISLFENLANEEEIPEHMIAYLLDYIATNEQIESFINECIAPYVQNMTIGQDSTEEFYRSIEIYNRQMANLNEDQMVVLLTPIYTAASLIQNAYLFVNDLVLDKKNIRDYTNEELGAYDIYRYLIKLVLNPLKEWILYHLDIEGDIPVLIVSSLGTLSANFMKNNAEEFLNKIEDNIREELKQLINHQESQSESEEELN